MTVTVLAKLVHHQGREFPHTSAVSRRVCGDRVRQFRQHCHECDRADVHPLPGNRLVNVVELWGNRGHWHAQHRCGPRVPLERCESRQLDRVHVLH